MGGPHVRPGLGRLPSRSPGLGSAAGSVSWSFFACEDRSELLGGPHRVLLQTVSEVAAKPQGNRLGPHAYLPA